MTDCVDEGVVVEVLDIVVGVQEGLGGNGAGENEGSGGATVVVLDEDDEEVGTSVVMLIFEYKRDVYIFTEIWIHGSTFNRRDTSSWHGIWVE